MVLKNNSALVNTKRKFTPENTFELHGTELLTKMLSLCDWTWQDNTREALTVIGLESLMPHYTVGYTLLYFLHTLA